MNQTREWFQANRGAYETLWLSPMRSLLSELQAPLARLYDEPLRPPKLFRLNRDVRFAKDKTPYKTTISAMVGLGTASGPFDGPIALYWQLGLEDSAGAGSHGLLPNALAKFRRLVMAEKSGTALEKLLRAARVKGLTTSSIEQLKRAPRGVPLDHPRLELLKHKGLSLGVEVIPKKVRFSKLLKPWLLEQAAHAAPVVRWLAAQKLYGLDDAR